MSTRLHFITMTNLISSLTPETHRQQQNKKKIIEKSICDPYKAPLIYNNNNKKKEI